MDGCRWREVRYGGDYWWGDRRENEVEWVRDVWKRSRDGKKKEKEKGKVFESEDSNSTGTKKKFRVVGKARARDRARCS